MALALRLGGIIPFGGLGGSLLGALGGLAARFGATAIAAKLAVAWIRTGGLIMNTTGTLPGLPIPSTPATRLLLGPFTFFPTTLATPQLNSFIKGFAYRDTEEMARGWLSLFGELVLKDVPGVEGNTETALRRLGEADFVGFGEAAANAVAEDVGLSSVAAFFRGIAEVAKDAKAVGLPGLPAPAVFSGALGAIVWLDQAISGAGGFLGGLLGGTLPPFEPELPTTEEEVKRAVRRVRRVFRGVSTLAPLIKGEKGTKAAEEKLARLTRRLFG